VEKNSWLDNSKWLGRSLSRLSLHLVYFLSWLAPRDEKTIVCGSGDGERFADNAKYFFLHLANNKKGEVRAIWISKNKNIVRKLQDRKYEAYRPWSWQGIKSLLKAKHFVTDAFSDATNYWLSGGAKKINLWHGIPLKKISYDAKRGQGSQYFNARGIKKILYYLGMPWLYEKNDCYPISSEFWRKYFSSAFQAPKNKFIITGHPRHDIFFKEFANCDVGSSQSAYEQVKSLKKNNKLIFYLPTYRDNGANPFEASNFDFAALNSFLEQNQAVFISKLHRLSKSKSSKQANYSRIINLPFETDVYHILAQIDVLVTDYSSIYFDFLLLDKPMVFFSYDLEEYMANRELYFDYNEFTPGPKADSFDNLLGSLKEILGGEDKYQAQREKLRDLCFKYQDGEAGERIYQAIFKK